MARELNELQPTRGRFALVGKISGLHGEKSLSEGISDKTGNDWRSLNFSIQTSPTNKVFVSLLGAVQDEIYATKTEKDNSKTTKTFEWDDRYDLPEGFHMIGVRCFIEPEEDGKGFVSENKHPFDAIEYIRDYLEDGDSVVVRGQLEFSTYETDQGQTRKQVKFIPNYVSKIKDEINFEAEDFEETSAFQQEIVIVGTDVDTDRHKVRISAYTIRKVKGEMVWTPSEFVVDEETTPKMYEVFPKKVKFGDLMTVSGAVVRATIVEEVEEVEEDEFGSKTVKGLKRGTRNNINELRIMSVDKDEKTKETLWKKKHYKEEQFIKAKAEEDFGNTGKNPFKGNVDISDDDLPF